MKQERMTAQEYRKRIKNLPTDANLEARTSSYAKKRKNACVGQKEHEIQKQMVDLFRRSGFKVYLMDVMTGVGYFGNGDGRRFAFIKDLKARGYEKGQPDLCVIRNKVFFLELKRPWGGRLSKEQRTTAEWLRGRGHNYALISTLDEVQQIISNPNN